MRIALALFVLTLLPGIPLAVLNVRRLRDGVGWLAIAGTLGVLWSVFTTLGLTLAHLPLTIPWVMAASGIPLAVVAVRPAARRVARETLRGIRFARLTTLLAATAVAVLAVPFFSVNRGLPTGDIQKSIFWGERVLEMQRLPAYGEALRFNRDPADFATPGLHTLTAAVIAVSGDRFRGPAWFAFFTSVLLAGLAAALASTLVPKASPLPLLAFLFAATNLRFLRYIQFPGYHYQNLLGELFLVVGFLFLLQAVGGRGGLAFLLLAGLSATALPIVHQFTAFLALLLFPAIFVLLLVKFRGELVSLVLHLSAAKRRLLLLALLCVGAPAGLLLAAGPLAEKLPHLLTAAPHLNPYLVPPALIPELLGLPFVLLGIAGVVVALAQLRRQNIEWRWTLVLAWIALLAALSQGARWVIDIPSARTLFYLTVPLSLPAALAVTGAVERIRSLWPRSAPALVPLALALSLAPTMGDTLNARLQNIDHALQANATLTPETLDFLAWLAKHPPPCQSRQDRKRSCPDGILVDDWNRRRATWAMLSPYRMLTRVGADLTVIARESAQSDQRREQYEALLDFEKIYALGNSPAIVPLLERHGIAIVIGANRLSRNVFAHNPALEPWYENGEVTVFRLRQTARETLRDSAASFLLLDRRTLANDIGDEEDTFEHLPISLLAPQISEMFTEGNDGGFSVPRTVRDVRSLESTIGLNVGAYVPHLWDADGNLVVDAPLELTLHVIGNGARGRLARGTKVFAKFSLPSDGEPHTIRATVPDNELPIGAEGLSTLTLLLDRGPLRIDLVAARLLP